MRTLARFVSGRRTAWAVLVATAVAVALLFAFLPSSEGDAAPPSGVPASSQSAEVTALLERFPSSDTTVGILVFSDGGDTLDDRALAAISARASALAELSTAREFSADIGRRLARFGRGADELKILPGATFVLGATEAEAEERYRHERRAQVSGATAVRTLEAVWGRDLSEYDPDGPLPSVDLVVENVELTAGRASHHKDRRGTAREWVEQAEAEGQSIRDAAISKLTRGVLVGTPAQVADRIDEFVQTDASDGFVLVPSITPGGLDEFVDTVIPLLQERGSYRSDYSGETLRENLFAR